MKLPTLALPMIAAAALSLAACSTQNDAPNAVAGDDIVLNDEDASASGNFVAEDPYGNTAAPGTDEASNDADGPANAR